MGNVFCKKSHVIGIDSGDSSDSSAAITTRPYYGRRDTVTTADQEIVADKDTSEECLK